MTCGIVNEHTGHLDPRGRLIYNSEKRGDHLIWNQSAWALMGVNKNPRFCRCFSSIHLFTHYWVNRQVWDEVSVTGVGFEMSHIDWDLDHSSLRCGKGQLLTLNPGLPCRQQGLQLAFSTFQCLESMGLFFISSYSSWGQVSLLLVKQ